MIDETDFDEYAGDYDDVLTQSLSISGESKDYFAEGRIGWLVNCLKQLDAQTKTILDFGCGTGTAAPFLMTSMNPKEIIGVDPSQKSLEVARRTYAPDRTRFLCPEDYEPNGQVDLAFCNGVFHHIAPAERSVNLDYIYRSLRPGGIFALWENNPLNPGTRYIMSRCPFDQDAITLTSSETTRLLIKTGFQVLRVDFLFIFPRILRWFRRIEPAVSRLPLGAQYQVLARKA